MPTRECHASAGFSQGWDFVVLSKPEERQAYWSATTDPDDEPDAWLEPLGAASLVAEAGFIGLFLFKVRK